ncbi:transcription factor Pcc1-domain-containing protein [Aspergillus unguis]
MAATQSSSTEFPCTLTISLPLPTRRLASSALRALEVDAELSPHVRRDFALKSTNSEGPEANGEGDGEGQTVLETTYKATTNRMLRVAVNGFMESLGVVLGVMEELDVDVLEEESKDQ